MAFTIPEALSDLPELLDLIQTIETGVSAPDKPEADKILDTIDATVPKLTKLVRTVIAQSKS